MTTFVTVGNARQPFGRLLSEVERICHLLPQPVIVQHGSTPFSAAGCISMPFLTAEEFLQNLQDAAVVIMHAGAGSIIHAVEAGKIPVVLARRRAYREIIDDHQVEFSEALASEHKIILMNEPRELLDCVRVLSISSYHQARCTQMPLAEAVEQIIHRIAGK